MTNRSTLSVSAGLVAVSVVVAGLWVSQGLRSGADRDRRPSSAAQSASEGQSIRTVYPGPLSGPAQGNSPLPQAGTIAAPPPVAAAPALASSTPPPDLRSSPIEPTPPEQQSDSTPITVATAETAATSSENQPASAGPGADLNTASVKELNALGAGMIGRRIIAFRPYASPEDLVTKRILKQADYEIIKAAVTVR